MNNVSKPDRRTILNAAAAGALGLAASAAPGVAEYTGTSRTGGYSAIRPFSINVPEAALVDLRKRLAATRLPEQETVSDNSQGVRLATIQKLLRYWANENDWRKVEAQLNAYPNIITEIDGEPERLLAKDDFLDNVTLYWLTNSATSSARLYWETSGQSVILAAAQKTFEISLPVAITVFPDEVYRAPEMWARRAYRNLIYFHEVDKGGHFAAWEEPELFSAELRAAFRSLRTAQ